MREDEALVQTSDNAEPLVTDPEGGSVAERSLYDDAEALLADARTYFDAELSYQKSRAGFVANRVKLIAICGLAAVFLAVIAVIGLTVGAIIALTPLLTAWGATAAVVLTLLFVAFMLVLKAKGAATEMSEVMKASSDETEGSSEDV